MRFIPVAELEKFVAAVEKDAGKLQDKIHRTAMSILKAFHDDQKFGATAADLMTRLANASPYHGRAFATWVRDLTPFEWSDENSTFYVHKDRKLMGKEFIAIRDGKTFFEYKPASEVKPLNDIEELEKLLARVMKRQENPKEGDVVHPKLWRAVTSAIVEAKKAA